MPLIRQSVELGISSMRRSLAYSQLFSSQPLVQNLHRFSNVRCQPCTRFNRLGRNCLPNGRTQTNIGTTANYTNRVIFYGRLLMSSYIRERLYDNLILFTRMLHKQSNVYLCLRLRRFTQICTLYRRLYSPHEFKNLFLDRLKQLASLLQKSSHFNIFSRNRLLLSFVSVGLFSWEDSRITDDELKDLMKEFMLVENSKEKLSNEDHESYGTADNADQSNLAKSEESSYMVVNCLQKSKEKWEEVINQPNFHVWRKPVTNTSLYEYKVFGSFYDISAYSFYTVQRDLQFRKEWDKLVCKLDIIDMEPDADVETHYMDKNIDDSGNELVHWVMKYPYPMRNREYLFIRRSRIDYKNRFIVLISRSVPYPKIPETDEHVRVHDYMSQMVIRPHQNDIYEFGFDYMLTYFDDPRASFPSPAYNWMASRGVPDFVEKLHQAALSLSAEKQQKECNTANPEMEHIIISDNTSKASPQDDDNPKPDTIFNQDSKENISSALPNSNLPSKDKQKTPSNSQLTNINYDRNQKNGKNKETSTFSFKSLIWS